MTFVISHTSDAAPSLTQQYAIFSAKNGKIEDFYVESGTNSLQQIVYTIAHIVAGKLDFRHQTIKRNGDNDRLMAIVREKIVYTKKRIDRTITTPAEADMMGFQEIPVLDRTKNTYPMSGLGMRYIAGGDIPGTQPAEDWGLGYPSRDETIGAV